MYLLVLVTGGAFAFIWLVLMMRDIRRGLRGRSAWPIFSIFLLGGLAVHIILLVMIIGSPFGSAIHRMLILPDVFVTLMLVSLEIAFVVAINNRINIAIGSAPSAWTTISMIFLTFLAFISLVVLQWRLNQLATPIQQ